MELHISLDGVGDRADRIYRQLADAIVDGRLRADEALPPSRELARQLAVSRTTVSVAYDRLVSEGYTIARVGSGTFVARRAAMSTRRAPRGDELRPRADWRHPDMMVGKRDAAAYDFGIGLPDPGLFPLTTWRGLVVRELVSDSSLLGGYRAPAGSRAFREAIARHVGIARSVRAGADDVLATSGAQQAFDLIGRVLISPGDVVAVEEPGYPPVRSLFESLGAKVVGVEVDGEGILVDRIPARARIVYTTPSHQFPTGVRSSLARRTALLEWAEARGGVIIEDDYDSEFRFEDRPVDPLQSLDRAGRVIYVGTFSKSLLPGLRIGFLVAPQSIMPALREARQLSDWHGDVVTQAALARLIDTGAFAAHVRRANRVYAIRRASILDTVSAELSGLVSIVPSVAGLHIAVEFASGSGLDGFRVRDAATADGVAVQALEAFAAVSADSTRGRTRPGLVLGFGLIPDQHIAAGVHRLARVIRRLAIARA